MTIAAPQPSQCAAMRLPQEVIDVILASSYDEITVFDSKGYIIFENKYWGERYGEGEKSFVGHHISSFTEGLCDVSVAGRVFTEKQSVHMLQKVLRDQKIYLVTGIPLLDDNNEIAYIITVSRDLSLFNSVLLSESAVQKPSISQGPDERIQDVLSRYQYVAHSVSMRQLFHKAERLARVDSTLLITGESGTGKSFLTRVIHDLGARADGKLIAINCAAIPSELLEAELFGYEPGAFTGASKKGKPGLFELASGGTLFLDEIGELSLPVQGKLLSALQDRKIRRVGGVHDIVLNIRLVCATNADLMSMVREKLFREDLYYRINVLHIEMPSLRQRVEDFIPLIEYNLQRINKKYSKECIFSDEAIATMQYYSWPGNIRELENVVEGLVAMSTNKIIATHDLPQYITRKTTDFLQGGKLSYDQAIDNFSQKLIIDAFKKHANSYKVAEALGISQSKASRLIRKYCTQN